MLFRFPSTIRLAIDRNWIPDMHENQHPSLRQSPLQAMHEEIDSVSSARESEQANRLGLGDRSLLEKWGVRGTGAAEWLSGMGVNVPADVYATDRLSGGGLIARIGKEEFFLESAKCGDSFASLRDSLPPAASFTSVLREDASLLVTGSRSLELFAQTCSHHFESSPAEHWIYTRIAGVNCGVLPHMYAGTIEYHLWLDPSYAAYLWQTLLVITTELGGSVIESFD